ncbi:Multidrug resistance-associated protein 4 [Boothiomyces sp. JEL0866]|nr:Multidrug resistance-associated protein 4 [Boothiomyces sp. JEL0866]
MEKLNVTKVKRRQDSNIFSKWTFSYLNPIIHRGLKRELVEGDYQSVEDDDNCEYLSQRFLGEWEKAYAVTGQGTKLFPVLVKVFGQSYAIALIPFFVEAVMQVLEGYFLGQVLLWFQTPNVDANTAYFNAIGLSIALFIHSFLHHVEFFMGMRVGMQMRIGLIASIYRKALNLSIANTSSTGFIINLVSNDVQRFEDASPFLPFLVVGPFQFVASMYFVYLEIGWSMLATAIVTLMLVPLQGTFARTFGRLRKVTVKFRDERIKSISDMLAGIMVVKLYGWEKPFMKKINEYRNSEMLNIWKGSVLKAINLSLFFGAASLNSVITFTTFYLAGGELTAARVFTVTTYISFLKLLMSNFFPLALQFIAECNVSIQRIQEFMLLPEISSSKELLRNQELYNELDDSSVLLAMDNASFSWEKAAIEKGKTEQVEVLKNINFTLRKKELVAVCGFVGAGKSSFLHAILGDMNFTSGRVYNDVKRIAYVSQTPWILSGTIRDNILFGQAYDEKRFFNVVKVCSLERDFSLFENGADTIIGERGVTLSGGQKARVALARAIYYDADLYILDDPLSAVDTKVARILFEDCICGALASKTVILVTHQLQFVQRCSRIIILEEGRLIDSGSIAALQNSKSQFSKVIREFVSKPDEAEVVDHEEEITELPQIQNENRDSSDVEKKEFRKEESAIGNVPFSAYVRYLRNGSGAGLFTLLVFLLVFGQILTLAVDLWLARWSSLDAESQRKTIYLIAFVIIGIGAVGVGIGRAILFFFIGYRSSYRSFRDMLAAVFRSPMSFFQAVPHGRLLNRFAKDLNLMDENLPQTFFDFCQCIFASLSIFIVASVVMPYVMILLPFIAVFFYYLRKYYITTSRQVKRIEATTRSPVYSSFSTTLEGLSVIRAFSAEERFKSMFFHDQNTNTRMFFTYLSTGRWLGLRLDLSSAFLTALLTFGCIYLRGPLGVSAVSLGLLLSYMMQLTGLLQWAVRQSSEVENMMVSTERVYEYTQLPPEAADELEFKSPTNWPTAGDLDIKNMTLAYPNLVDPSLPPHPVLKGLNIHIEAGTKVGIVGRTGAGKSSFLQALFRLVEPTPEKSIVIDGIATSDLGLTDLRSKISIIPQEPFCFKGTIRFNLDPFDQFSDEKLWSALEAVELKSTLEGMAEKLDSPVTENGANWSVGERQLICLARAILKNTRLIVMDEATSSVDIHTDKLIQKAIRQKGGLFSCATVLTIAHRLNTVIDYDKILVLEAGEIVEYGAPWDLLNKSLTDPSAWFARMVNEMGAEAQSGLLALARAAKDQQ